MPLLVPCKRGSFLMPTEKTPPSAFGRFIKSAMDMRGWNQVQLSNASGIAQNTISTWLTTNRIPERPNIEKAVRALAPTSSSTQAFDRMLSDALSTAMEIEEVEYGPAEEEEAEVLRYWRGSPPEMREAARVLLQAKFKEEDEEDRAEGRVGKRAE